MPKNSKMPEPLINPHSVLPNFKIYIYELIYLYAFTYIKNIQSNKSLNNIAFRNYFSFTKINDPTKY